VSAVTAVLQAIDHTTQVLSLQYNRGQPVIFNTYQAYLKDSHTRLMEDMERARREGYTFAAKLVSHLSAMDTLHADGLTRAAVADPCQTALLLQ
jgi:hypothetical protein